MKKKGSMELSVNSIVILVIAVVMMGLILGFIRSKFADISGGFIVDESAAPEASASDPITLSRVNVPVNGVKKTGLNVNFYNMGADDPIGGAFPLFQCNDGTVNIVEEYYEKDAVKSKSTEYTGNIKLASSVARNTYLCKVCFLTDAGYTSYAENNKCGANVVSYKEFNLIVQ